LPSIPKDPFDVTPLRWKKTSTGFRIESSWIGGSVRMDSQDPEQRGNGMEFWDAEQRGKLPAVPLPDDPGKPLQVPCAIWPLSCNVSLAAEVGRHGRRTDVSWVISLAGIAVVVSHPSPAFGRAGTGMGPAL